ncbi:transketolase C-terminal domain-containing protein [Chloroflexota bacterium]
MSQRKFMDAAGEIDRLDLLATTVRKNTLDNIAKTKAGHPGGSMSAADILTTLYFGRTCDPETGLWENIMRYDPSDPLWANRDRFILSKGHAAPVLYATLVQAGFYEEAALKIYRKIDSPFQGHPSMYRAFRENGKTVEQGTKGVDFCSGSLGQGFSAAGGMALHAKVYGYDYNVFAILGDGEVQEGIIWEACLTIPNKKLNNLCAFIDRNGLQVDGCVDDINSLDPLVEKLRAFNWDVRVIDGHNFHDIIDSLDYFKKTRHQSEKPLMVIANTVKGKGVPEIENDNRYHSLPLSLEQFERAERALSAKIEMLEKKIASQKFAEVKVKPLVKAQPEEKQQDLREIIRKNPVTTYTEPTATRIAYGNALARLGEYQKLFVLDADLGTTCQTGKFAKLYPEKAPIPSARRSINVGVQEQNMMATAAGMASCGKISVVNSIGIFATGRAWEMIRQGISYPRLNVKIIGNFGGIAAGEGGVSHQTTEDLGAMRIMPNVIVIEPSDAIQTELLFEKALQHEGPVYLRTARSNSELIYADGNPYGVAPIRDFEIGKGYKIKDGKDITLIGSGPILNQVLMAAQMVKESVRVIDMPTVRPADGDIIEQAAKETGRICTVQDHFENGGLNDEVLRVLAARRLSVTFDFIALSGFTRSGTAEDVYEMFGLSARRIVEKLGLTAKA